MPALTARVVWSALVTVTATAALVGRTPAQSSSDSSLQLVGRGSVSTDAPEFSTTLTPDGREIYFNRASADRTRLTIMRATRQADGSWAAATTVSFSGTHRDVDPFVTPDGRRLYFSSDRPRRVGTKPQLATWYVERRDDGSWGPPIDPGPPLNSEAGDVFVSGTRDGQLVFGSARDGASRVFATRESGGRWTTPVAQSFGASNDGGNPAIAPSGRFLVMVRASAGGAADLLVSCRSGDGWTGPRPLTSTVNSPFADFAPYVDAGERFLYFTSERPGVVGAVADGVRPPGDLYRIGLAEAGIRCP